MNVLESFCAPLLSDDATDAGWPRPDFRMAQTEFLIGLLALACPPPDLGGWRAWWRQPPSPERLLEAFAPYRHAFALDGDGPRFMQDREDLPGEPDLPESLLIEAPGGATRRNNTALLVKPDRVRVLSRRAAAMALFTLQTYAPAGGRGNLTSVRGGGPLTTVVMPGEEPGEAPRVRLWRLLWANVPIGVPVPPDRLALALPWLAQTRTADRYPVTAPDGGADPLQAFFGMPRRIRLDFAANTGRIPCDLTGEVDEVIVTGWRQRPNGVKYVGFSHPLSPYYTDPKSGRLPLHPQPGGIGYRHWLGLVFGDAKKGRFPAAAVATWRERAADVDEAVERGARLFAGGYDMDNMKARGFVESEMPLPGTASPEAQARTATLAKGLIGASETAARALRLCIRDAVLAQAAALDSGPLASAFEQLWTETEPAFFDALGRAAAPVADEDDPDAALSAEAPGWRARLHATALRLFDLAAPLDPSAVSFDFRRIVAARRSLVRTLTGYGPIGVDLFKALGLPDPSPPAAKPKKSGRRKAA